MGKQFEEKEKNNDIMADFPTSEIREGEKVFTYAEFSRSAEEMAYNAYRLLLCNSLYKTDSYGTSLACLLGSRCSCRTAVPSVWAKPHRSGSGKSTAGILDGEYTDLDITNLLREERTGFLKRSEALILRTSVKDSGFCAIATGDSYFVPQILEVNFR